MPQKQQKNAQASHSIELGGYQYWPVLVPRGIRLYTYEQIPVFLRENPYITDGYRAYLPSRLCIKRWEDFQNVLQLIYELFWFHKLHRSINNIVTATECSTYLSLCPKPQSLHPLMWLKAVWSKLMISVCCDRWFLGGEWHVFMWMIVFVLFCFLSRSLFILSNETVNIWSHLLGFVLFFCVGVYNMATVLPAVGASREDYVIYSIGLFCFQVQSVYFSCYS